MNIFTRILLILCAIFFIIVSSLTLIIAFNINVLTDIYYYLYDSIYASLYSSAIIITIALIFLTIAIILFVLGIKTKKDKKHISKHTNMGEVKISFITIENIVINTANKFGDIKNISVAIYKLDEDINITIKAAILPDVCIPVLSEQIQISVKEAVEESTGIIVKDVNMHIQSIYSEPLDKNSIVIKH